MYSTSSHVALCLRQLETMNAYRPITSIMTIVLYFFSNKLSTQFATALIHNLAQCERHTKRSHCLSAMTDVAIANQLHFDCKLHIMTLISSCAIPRSAASLSLDFQTFSPRSKSLHCLLPLSRRVSSYHIFVVLLSNSTVYDTTLTSLSYFLTLVCSKFLDVTINCNNIQLEPHSFFT